MRFYILTYLVTQTCTICTVPCTQRKLSINSFNYLLKITNILFHIGKFGVKLMKIGAVVLIRKNAIVLKIL